MRSEKQPRIEIFCRTQKISPRRNMTIKLLEMLECDTVVDNCVCVYDSYSEDDETPPRLILQEEGPHSVSGSYSVINNISRWIEYEYDV